MIVATFFVVFLSSTTSGCYFPVEMQGEFMTQWLQSSDISYTSLSILYNSIPGWGACHSRRGSEVILKQGSNCFRCVSLVQRSASVQQLVTRDIGQCHPTERLARRSCPQSHELARRQLTEMMLYKTRGFYGEAAAGESHCPMTGRHSVEEKCGDSSVMRTGEGGTCPSESRLSLALPCSNTALSLQCLGHWLGEDGQHYLALLDTQLPQLGEEPRPRYRCAIYLEESGVTRMALGNDSTCRHQLSSHKEGAQVVSLRKQEIRSPRSHRGQRLPSWAQGKWKDLKVEGAAITYRDAEERTTLHLRALARRGKGKWVVSVDTECGQAGGFTCLSLEQRAKGILELQLSDTVGSMRSAALLCDASSTKPWVTQSRSESHREACPLPGEFTGVIPDSGDALCATSKTSCSSPHTMTYKVFSCSNSSTVYEEREYLCQGQFTEQSSGLTYTLTRRLDLDSRQECFVGMTDMEGRRHRVLEAGVHCARERDVRAEGMVMERVGQEGDHCEDDVLVRTLRPRVPSHPVYGGEESYIRVLDIQIDNSISSHRVNSEPRQRDNSVPSQAQPQHSGTGARTQDSMCDVAVFIVVALLL